MKWKIQFVLFRAVDQSSKVLIHRKIIYKKFIITLVKGR